MHMQGRQPSLGSREHANVAQSHRDSMAVYSVFQHMAKAATRSSSTSAACYELQMTFGSLKFLNFKVGAEVKKFRLMGV